MEALQKKCTCGGGTAGDLSEAIGKRCLRCCGRFLEQARAWSLALGTEPHIVTAIKLDLVEIVRLLLPIQRPFVDENGKRAADHALELDSPGMWALFSDEIPRDVVDVLLKAREARCVCLKKAENLVEAADNQCLVCCFEYRSQIGKKVDDWTALMKAAFRGNLDIAKLVVRKEAKIQRENGATALMNAAQEGHLDVVKLLVEHEARIQRNDGTTALLLAAFKGHTEVVKLLAPHEAKIQKNNGFTALMNAAQEGHTECVRALIPFEAKVTGPNGLTALMSAAMKGHVAAAQLLIPFEAKMQNIDGWTALMIAALYGHLEAAKLLVGHEAKMQDEDMTTALQLAAFNGRTEVVQLLAQYEAKMQRGDDAMALMAAAQEGHTECVRALIPFEAKMARPNGQTALMSAAMQGHFEIVKLLLPYEAGLQVEDGSTATTMAAYFYQPKCFEELMKNEAEREASQIPEVMVSAYAGDVRDLLARQGEWQTKQARPTTLDFALLGNQGRAVRLLAGSVPLRELFARYSIPHFIENVSNAIRFLSSREQLIHGIAPVISAATTQLRSELLGKALAEQHRNATRVLRAICTPDADSTFGRLEKCEDEAQVVLMLAGLKHVGFSNDWKTMEIFAKKLYGPVWQYLASNPLKQAQTRRAKKEVWRSLPNEKQACWRETEAESAFNRSLIARSRDAILSASRPPRRIPDHNSTRIRQKQVLNRRLLLDFVRSMQGIVQEMLDE